MSALSKKDQNGSDRHSKLPHIAIASVVINNRSNQLNHFYPT